MKYGFFRVSKKIEEKANKFKLQDDFSFTKSFILETVFKLEESFF